MRFCAVQSAQELIALVEQVGFLPFFETDIPGFSVEACCPPQRWFSDNLDGPWEWKGPVARSGRCLYGKFFENKAGFVSREWFFDFANYRRDGYDLDARYDDGLCAKKDKDVWEAVVQNGPILSKNLKDLCNYRKGGNKGFETVITRLQMQTYVTASDFVYLQDKTGKTYGWGVAQYAAPETWMTDFAARTYACEPAESKQRMRAHLRALLPDVPEKRLERLLG